MSQAVSKPTVASMLHETQVYRASLESLYEMGRALLDHPSMESSSAVAFQVLTENVLEQADHQGDLVVVDGVDEPQAKVELIMQDVLQPRLTEVEQIEQALAAKDDDAEGEAFITSHHATQVSAESLTFSLEMLALHTHHLKAVKQVISMEGMTTDFARPLLTGLMQTFGDYTGGLGISMESVGQTQVLGDMSDAVDRIEQLVEKAHEQVVEQAEAFRSVATQLGTQDTDRMAELIDKYREENPSGVVMDQDTKVSSIANDTPNSDQADDSSDIDTDTEGDTDDLTELVPAEPDEDESEADTSSDESDEIDDESEMEDDLESDSDAGESDETDLDLDSETDNDQSGEEETDSESDLDESETDLGDETETDLSEGEEQEEDETDPELGDETGDESEVDPDLDAESDETDETEGTVVELEGDDDQSEEEAGDAEEESEEEEEDGTASTESLTEPVVFDPDVWGERAPEVRGFHTQLLRWMAFHDLLTAGGVAVAEQDDATDFVLSTDLMTDHAADVLVKHYETWINAALRDGEANMLSLGVLMGV